jgi:hypothetical protein
LELIKTLFDFLITNQSIIVPLGTVLAAFVSAFAAFMSAAASWTSARVAKSQRELAERQYELQRLHQELEAIRAKREIYDRQLSVYQAVKVLLTIFEGRAGVSKQDADTFSQCRAEADFLFRDDAIPEYLKQMSINAQLLAHYQELINDTYAMPVGEQRTEYVKKAMELQMWFSTQREAAKEKFKPYLDISMPTTSLPATL